MPKGIPLTDEEQQRRRKEIFEASLHLFLEKGFNETSMREIAEAAGVGKSTLYDYYKTKDEILVSYFQSQIERLTSRAAEIIRQELEQVRKAAQDRADAPGLPGGEQTGIRAAQHRSPAPAGRKPGANPAQTPRLPGHDPTPDRGRHSPG